MFYKTRPEGGVLINLSLSKMQSIGQMWFQFFFFFFYFFWSFYFSMEGLNSSLTNIVALSPLWCAHTFKAEFLWKGLSVSSSVREKAVFTAFPSSAARPAQTDLTGWHWWAFPIQWLLLHLFSIIRAGKDIPLLTALGCVSGAGKGSLGAMVLCHVLRAIIVTSCK